MFDRSRSTRRRLVSDVSLRDVRWVAQQAPGLLIYHVTPGSAGGGRSVLSFLDVSGPDGASIDDLNEVLAALREHIKQGRREPLERKGFGADFYAGPKFPADALVQEFESLANALQLFAHDAFKAQPPKREFTVTVRHQDGRTVFAWDDESAVKLKEFNPDWLSSKVSISDDTRELFEEIHGPFYPHAIVALCPVDEDRLRELGGARIIDADSKRTLWFTKESEPPG